MLNAYHCFNNGFIGKQLVIWEEYCSKYLPKETPKEKAWI